MTGYEIALLIFAVAFAVLVIFLSILLYNAATTLKKTNRIMDTFNDITLDVNSKMEAFDPWFRLLGYYGEELENKRERREKKHYFSSFTKKTNDGEGKEEVIRDLGEWALFSVRLWQKYKSKRY